MRKALALAARRVAARPPIPAIATPAAKAQAPQRAKGATGVQRRIRVIETDKCAQVRNKRAQVIKVSVVDSDAPMSMSTSTMAGVATEPTDIRGSVWTLAAGTDLADAMSTSTCVGDMATAQVAARRFCVAIGNAELAENDPLTALERRAL
jgi:hypothetical protein